LVTVLVELEIGIREGAAFAFLIKGKKGGMGEFMSNGKTSSSFVSSVEESRVVKLTPSSRRRSRSRQAPRKGIIKTGINYI